MSQMLDKHMQFTSAGRQLQMEERITVNDHVYIPDGNASESIIQKLFESPRKVKSHARIATVSKKSAILLIMLMSMGMGLTILKHMDMKTDKKSELSALCLSIQQMASDNAKLSLHISELKDESRICYLASRNLGMISAEGVDVIFIDAPNTRPGNESDRIYDNRIGEAYSIAQNR